MSKKSERKAEYRRLAKELFDLLTDRKSVKKAEGDEQRSSFRYTIWAEAETALDIDETEHSVIMQACDELNLNVININQGLFVSKVEGDKVLSFIMLGNLSDGILKNIGKRINTLEEQGKLSAVIKKAAILSYDFPALQRKIKEAGGELSAGSLRTINQITSGEDKDDEV